MQIIDYWQGEVETKVTGLQTCGIERSANGDLVCHVSVGPLGCNAKEGLGLVLSALCIGGPVLQGQLDLYRVCQAVACSFQGTLEMGNLALESHLIVMSALDSACACLKYLILHSTDGVRRASLEIH